MFENKTVVNFLGIALVGLGLYGIVRPQEEVRKKLTVHHFKDEPLEILSIKLRGTELRLDKDMVSQDDLKELVVTVKNISEKPISLATIFIVSASDKDEVMPSTGLIFNPGKDGPMLQPDEVTTMKWRYSSGDASIGKEWQLQLDEVIWDHDASVKWSSGFMLERVEDGKYYPRKKPLAKYNYPKGFSPSPRLVKAVDDPSGNLKTWFQYTEG